MTNKVEFIDTKIYVSEESENKDLVEVTVTNTFKNSPRYKPRVQRPRRVPLNKQIGWGNRQRAVVPVVVEEKKDEEFEGEQEVEIEKVLFGEEEEEEEDDGFKVEKIATPCIEDHYLLEEEEDCDRREDLPKYKSFTRTSYTVYFQEEDVNESDRDSEVEGIDYPDNEFTDDDDDMY